jgi:hypothetical protein
VIKQLACDIINDVTLIQTSHSGPSYHVRYGLEVTPFEHLEDAMSAFYQCQLHALTCEGHLHAEA